MAFYPSAFVTMHTIDVNKNQNRHEADTTNSRTHDDPFEAAKSILGPETTKKSTRRQKGQKLNRMCLE
jgi:hypothetical protein